MTNEKLRGFGFSISTTNKLSKSSFNAVGLYICSNFYIFSFHYSSRGIMAAKWSNERKNNLIQKNQKASTKERNLTTIFWLRIFRAFSLH